MLKRSRFLPKQSLLDLYFKVIFPSVIYALPVWDGFTCKDNFNSLERLHCRAARIIYRLVKDKPSINVLKEKWNTLFYRYKLSVVKLIYKIYGDLTLPIMSHIIEKNGSKYNLKNKN